MEKDQRSKMLLPDKRGFEIEGDIIDLLTFAKFSHKSFRAFALCIAPDRYTFTTVGTRVLLAWVFIC